MASRVPACVALVWCALAPVGCGPSASKDTHDSAVPTDSSASLQETADTAETTDTSASETTDTSAPTSGTGETGDTSAPTGATGDTAETGDTGASSTPVRATLGALTCEYPYTPPPESLSAQDLGGGNVAVEHIAFYWGCCPDFGLSAQALAGNVVQVTYTFYGDDECDCICLFDVTYTLDGLSTGLWTVQANGQSTEVYVSP